MYDDCAFGTHYCIIIVRAGVGWGLPCWVKLGVRSIEESDQKDVDADRGHIPWAVSVRDTTSWKHVGLKSEELKASESQLLCNIVLYYHNCNHQHD